MNFINAGPSPAWLGVIAVVSFGGLVMAAFASGYHLASDPPPNLARAPISAAKVVQPEADVKFFHTGSVAEPLVDRDQAVLRAAPGADGEVIDELPAGRSVSITAESGDWLFVRYDRDGKDREGWTHRVNIQTGD